MTRLPQVERELVAAAARLHEQPRVRAVTTGGRAARRLVPALIAGLAVAGALLLASALRAPSDENEASPPPAVPAATIALSSELAKAPPAPPSGRLGADALRENRIAAGEQPALIAEIERQTPFPPDRLDTGDLAAVPFRNDLQALIEFRSACLWMQYWLAARDGGQAAAADGAAAVLADVPSWPTFEVSPDLHAAYGTLAAAADAGDAAPILRDVRTNCHNVP
jgi:hypothetical protein